jgi:hypothetical protein
VVDAAITRKVIAVTFIASSRVLRATAHEKRRYATSSAATPRHPSAADSVGDAIPRMIVPTTSNTITDIGTTLTITAASFSRSV